MKKFLVVTFVTVMMLSLVACKDTQEPKPTYNNPAQNATTNANTTADSSINDDDLKDIASAIVDAEEDADRIAALLVRNWTTDSYFVYFYDKSRFSNSSFEDEEDFADVHKYRGEVEKVLDTAKEQLGMNGTGDFYAAVKDYYLALNNYLALLSEYPTGYSKLTYSAAISECQNECRTTRTEVDFYTE